MYKSFRVQWKKRRYRVSASRVIGAATLVMLKLLFRARVVVLAAVIQPILFASLAGLLFNSGGHKNATLSWSIGASVMGLWSSVLFFGGGILTRERRQRTLEMLVATPAPLVLVVIGACLATAMLALYSLLSTFTVAIVFFRVSLQIAHPAQFGLAIVVSIVSVGLSGVALASLFIMFRQAGIFQNALEYPVWIASGLLAPISLLPGPVQWIGRLLPTTWAYESLKNAAEGASALSALLLCAACGLAYLIAGCFLLAMAEHRARVLATLPMT
jgi:ABC-2 type transport system permease protein